ILSADESRAQVRGLSFSANERDRRPDGAIPDLRSRPAFPTCVPNLRSRLAFPTCVPKPRSRVGSHFFLPWLRSGQMCFAKMLEQECKPPVRTGMRVRRSITRMLGTRHRHDSEHGTDTAATWLGAIEVPKQLCRRPL